MKWNRGPPEASSLCADGIVRIDRNRPGGSVNYHQGLICTAEAVTDPQIHYRPLAVTSQGRAHSDLP